MKNINWQYAIGEVIIVIIGISIAFSLNNWAQKKAAAEKEAIYLEHLAEDLQDEKKQLEALSDAIKKKIEIVHELRPVFGSGADDRRAASGKFFQLMDVPSFIPETTTYSSLVNSGDMNLITDFELRRAIEKHYANHKVIAKDYSRIEQIFKKYIADFFIHNINFNKVFQGDYSYLDDPLLGNIVNSLFGSLTIVEVSNQKGISSTEKLIESLNDKIKP